MLGAELMKGNGVYLIDLYQFKGRWYAGYAAIANGSAVVTLTDPDTAETLTIKTPEPGSYTNLELCLL